MAAKRRAETMEENRTKLIGAARKAFAASGFAAASMDDLTAQVGLTRGALYHGFGDKKGLLGPRRPGRWRDGRARATGGSNCGRPLGKAAGRRASYIRMALDPEVRRIVLFGGCLPGRPLEMAEPECLPEHHEAGGRRFDRRGCHEARRYRGGRHAF